MPTVSGTDARSWAVALGAHRVTVRLLVFWGGIAFWIGSLILRTGTNGIGALWASLLFVAAVAIITSATRTITLQRVAVLYCLGGTMMGVGWLISVAFHTLVPDPDAVSAQFFVPMVEESIKLAPVVFIAWRQRETRLWTMGASDFLLMGPASGAGFGLVEEAHIRI
jgi:RsiW-degrading membrane proteinase PrsW (M82 family)